MMSSPLAEKTRRASAAISDAVDRHGSAVLKFSGGKESVVLADLAQTVKDRVTLLWVNSGIAFEHMAAFVRSYSATFKLVEVNGNALERFRTHGLPSKLVPIANHLAGATGLDKPDRVLISDWLSCCADVRSKPSADYVARHSITLVIHGQRRQDNFHARIACTESVAPLWDWSTEDVMQYVRDRGLALPKQYPAVLADSSSAGGSMDCSLCTAMISEARTRYLREHEPAVYAQWAPMVRSVYDAIENAAAPLGMAMQLIDQRARRP